MKILLGCYLFVSFFIYSLNAVATNDVAQEEIKQAFQHAVDSNNIKTLNAFIKEYKYTGWELKAEYYRDKTAIDAAKQLGTVEALDQFLALYPRSDWYNHAVHYRDKAAYEIAKSKNSLKAYDEFVKTYPTSQWNKNIASLKAKLLSKKSQQDSPLTKPQGESANTTPDRLTPQQRTANALKIYAEIDAKKKKAEKLKTKKEKKRLALERKCYQLKDKLRKYSERRVWYNLNDRGERVFLSKKEIINAKERVSSKYQKKCSNM